MQTGEFIFLCHASEDRDKVMGIYSKLKEKDLNPWMDKEDLLPGQNWQIEIPKALKNSKFVLIFFSIISVQKHGYVQKEFKLSLDVLSEMPEDDIFIIPIRLDDCLIPDKFTHLHYCDYFDKDSFEKILRTITKSGTAVNLKKK